MTRLLHPAALVASVRLVGALLLAIGTVTGINVLGPAQFGISIIVLGAGQLMALPTTAIERLVLRLTAQDRLGDTQSAMKVARTYSIGVALLAVLLVWPLEQVLNLDPLLTLAVAATAVMVGQMTLNQAISRASGRLMWGQVPNELLRPTLTLASYFAALPFPQEHRGALSCLLVALLMAPIIALSPRTTIAEAPIPTRQSFRLIRTSVGSLFVISVIAACIERVYPMIVGGLDGPAAAATLAVSLRIIQLGLFGQAFAIYYYSPTVAAAMTQVTVIQPDGIRALRRIRSISALSAAPALTLCLIFPNLLERIFGADSGVEKALPFVCIAIVAQTLTGPTQAVLIMGSKEHAVAIVYAIAFLAAIITFVAIGSWTATSATAAIASTYCLTSVGQMACTRAYFKSLY